MDNPKCSVSDPMPNVTKLRMTLGPTILSASNMLKTREKSGISQIMHFLEKRGCGYLRVTLEPPLPDEQRRSEGTRDGLDGSGDADGWFGSDEKF